MIRKYRDDVTTVHKWKFLEKNMASHDHDAILLFFKLDDARKISNTYHLFPTHTPIFSNMVRKTKTSSNILVIFLVSSYFRSYILMLSIYNRNCRNCAKSSKSCKNCAKPEKSCWNCTKSNKNRKSCVKNFKS